ncbi:MAG TPA: hypothetical protein VHB73_05395, partial [Alphaproteobacteria bacterium]|nr:hypothetical protein [Alphaproteobacteria bacterium]
MSHALPAKRFFSIDIRNPFLRVFVPFGLVQGLLYYLLTSKGLWQHSFGEISPMHGRMVAACFLFHAGLTFFLVYRHGLLRRSAVVAGVFGLLQAGLWLTFHSLYPETRSTGSTGFSFGWLDSFFTFYSLSTIIDYVAMPFLQIYVANRRFSFPYENLFQHAWNNAQITFSSYLLTGLFWGTLWLSYALLNIVKINIGPILRDAAFICISFFTVKAIGYGMARDNEAMVGALRRLCLGFCRFLAPILSICAVVFLLGLLGSGLDTIWKTRMATPLLLSFVFLSILFFNSIFQDGKNDLYFSGLPGTVQRVALLTLPIFAGLGAYSIFLRIQQYGLTPSRFYAVLFTVFSGIYSSIYAVAAFLPAARRGSTIMRGNVFTAFLVLAVCIAVQLPPLSAAALSAAHQYYLFTSGRMPVEKFDFYSLGHRLGRPGEKALEKIQSLQVPSAPAIRQAISEAESKHRPYGAIKPANAMTAQEKDAQDAALHAVTTYLLIKPDGTTL